MNARELLTRLDALGVELVLGEAGRLKVSATRGQLDDSLKQLIALHKTELLELVAQRATTSGQIPCLPRGGALPLSLFQERLWVLQRLDPESTAYMLEAHWFTGHTAEQVVAVIEQLRMNHEGLRLAYVDDRGAPVARAAEPSPVQYIDLLGLDTDAQYRRLKEDLDRNVHTPLDLTQGVPVHFAVYALEPGRTLVALWAHHIALDAWSIDLVKREIDERLNGVEVPAAAAATPQYADFAAWQRATQDAGAIAAELDWWSTRLAGAPQLSAFPADRPHGGTPGGRSFAVEWDTELSAALSELARDEGVTVYMVLLAAFAALLRAHTGQGDVVLGSPMGLRERTEFERMVGPFVNLLLIRLDLSDDPSFATLLHRARDAMLDAHEHRQVPFEMMIERLRPARSLNHSPLFQTALVQHNATAPAEFRLSSGGALHDLTCFVREVGGSFSVGFEYRTDLYSAAAIERIAAELQHLLRGAIAGRTRPVSVLPLISQAERTRLLRDFNATTRAPAFDCFVREFERQAAATPARAAARFEGASIAYAHLNQRANQLARHLRERGAAPGALVGVCMERSLDLLVALIAVQKSGAAYVPLDPSFPAERLAYMLEDSGAALLVTGGGAAEALDLPAQLAVVDLQAEAAHLAGMDATDLGAMGAPADTAYVIYTSGSTGKPKGVAVPHGALANFLASMRREPGLAESDVLAAVTTISFDIAGLELYLPLIVGACVELVPRETASDGEALGQALAQSGATVLQATPATWRLLLQAGWSPARPMRALCGGEGLPRELADSLLGQVKELWNLYGPTETTIWSTLERVEAGAGPVSIGKPIDNTEVYVLDGAGQVVPLGVAGELWIGGQGVASGYHRRPELTAERFVPDRFSERKAARLYRTGDLARWDEHGRLFHLGRIDHQVKIRGFRIETGEIEAELATHPAVRQALVLAREAAPGDLRLMAYLVYESGEDLTVSDVRRHLRRRLPDYMVPSLVVALESLPQTPNGKTDRAALPDPFAQARRSTQHEAPLEGMEQVMAGIWEEMLKVSGVGAQDNFFELGGHSLLAFKVVAAVERATGWRMDPRILFFQTLRQVAERGAAAIAAAQRAKASP